MEIKSYSWLIILTLIIFSCSSESKTNVISKDFKKVEIWDTLMFETKNTNFINSFKVKTAILKNNSVFLNAENKIEPIWIDSINYISNNGENIFAIIQTPSKLTGFFQYENKKIKIEYVNNNKCKIKELNKTKFKIIIYEDLITSFEQETIVYKLFYLNSKYELINEFDYYSNRKIGSKMYDNIYEFIEEKSSFVIKKNSAVIESLQL